MSKDPSSTFGSLTLGCINDEYEPEGRFLLEEVLFFVLGAGTSVATTWLLSLVGFFV